ncbi:virginiamycin A acetyltransferase [Murinocardiopsis flavida]|uniref:Virginiamycin A acetyltransferase n=1 Tax=Murinocardiopsis flavida TaxID=645275 RepID=A0A2P8CVF7_9ACTN|nr:CatB-related O-acetyltransferase [Murinocardiopsis flavida]PSK88963.1 virginiamycin A acetyltransferase [Murinocardiopsis flavida]
MTDPGGSAAPGGAVPDPARVFPLAEGDARCVFIRPSLTGTLVEAGEYSYYDASEDGGASFEESRTLYAFGPEMLRIGRFCSIGSGVRFLLGGNHVATGPSTFPFTMFPGAWQDGTLATFLAHDPSRGDTVVGNDVWFGRDATVLPGVGIGDGAIIGAGAVVTRDVDPYTVVAGNPAREVRRRYSAEDAARLARAAWWDWPVPAITEHAAVLMAGSIEEIEKAAASVLTSQNGESTM